jgi:hypothetical protein
LPCSYNFVCFKHIKIFIGSVDSEVFDNGPFQSLAPAGGANSHVVSSPFEIAHYPIEVNEQKKAVQRQISER